MLVPTGELHALPWSLLPSLARAPAGGRAVAAAVAARHGAKPPASGRRVLVAGPRLPAATDEIETLARAPPGRARADRRRRDRRATSPRPSTAPTPPTSPPTATSATTTRSFCSLELADGALTVYDLERLCQTPRRLVLSSCESGLSTVHAGDELMGFTAALFALGTATVIAAVVPVPDEATKGLMLALDDELRAAPRPPTRSSRARAATDADERRRTVARAAFVCFGAG